MSSVLSESDHRLPPNIGYEIAGTITIEYELDLVDQMVERLNSGASISQLKQEIELAFSDRLKKIEQLRQGFHEQLDTALRITLTER